MPVWRAPGVWGVILPGEREKVLSRLLAAGAILLEGLQEGRSVSSFWDDVRDRH